MAAMDVPGWPEKAAKYRNNEQGYGYAPANPKARERLVR
jgi:hypothetical protein